MVSDGQSKGCCICPPRTKPLFQPQIFNYYNETASLSLILITSTSILNFFTIILYFTSRSILTLIFTLILIMHYTSLSLTPTLIMSPTLIIIILHSRQGIKFLSTFSYVFDINTRGELISLQFYKKEKKRTIYIYIYI